MRTYIFAIPLIAAAITLAYIIFREMTRVWLDHRVKMALLERLEHKPELLYSFQELQELLDDSPPPVQEKSKTDLTMTGVFLALIGLVSVIIYGLIGRSQWAVGAYFGGVACVVIGFILTTIGLVARILRKPPQKPE
ncbi:MAG TPA: hypothetical protein ENN29_04700 [Candidatus Hydrogenedentes bacterium]|nr:hypothetical protein [Candidatus Hydrogenedentota bacterium]